MSFESLQGLEGFEKPILLNQCWKWSKRKCGFLVSVALLSVGSVLGPILYLLSTFDSVLSVTIPENQTVPTRYCNLDVLEQT